MRPKGPITTILKDSPSYLNLITIQLSNKKVQNLRETLISVLKLNTYKQDAKLQIIANDNKIVNLQGIQLVCQKLASIKLHNNMIKCVKGIQNLTFPFLQKLYLEYNQITSLQGLQSCKFPRLIRLTINNNKLISQNVKILSKLNAPQLRVLGLDSNQLTDIQFVKQIKLAFIIDINLSNNKIINANPLQKCIFISKLSKLQLQNNKLVKVPQMKGYMYNLRKLLLSNNQIITAEPLITSQYPNLQVLQLQNNYITNITFLYRIYAPKLIDLKISKNKIIRINNKTFRYSYLPVLQQVLLKNNQITGNIIEQIMISFSDVRQARSNFYKNNNIQMASQSPGKTNKLNRIITANGNTLVESQNNQALFNNNKNFSMFSCWRNKLIYKNGPSTYGKMKKHFNKLSFLQF